MKNEKNNEKNSVGILYLCIHNKLLCRTTSFNKIYPKKEFFRMLGETFHVPKNMRVVVLKEMELMGLLKDLGSKKNNNIQVNRARVDIEREANKLYEQVGLY